MQYTKLIKDIPENKNWTKIELINKGWSHDIATMASRLIFLFGTMTTKQVSVNS